MDEFANGEPIELKAVGGGGTDFRPVFEHIEDNRMEPRCLIYLTDLAGKFPDEEPAFPVLWAATTDRTPPFGEKLRIFV